MDIGLCRASDQVRLRSALSSGRPLLGNARLPTNRGLIMFTSSVRAVEQTLTRTEVFILPT